MNVNGNNKMYIEVYEAIRRYMNEYEGVGIYEIPYDII